MRLLRFLFEVFRDLVGFAGAVVGTSAFFRFERRKQEAAAVRDARADDQDLQAELGGARTRLEARVLGPNEIDTRLTAGGLALIAISFLTSIALTFTEDAQKKNETRGVEQPPLVYAIPSNDYGQPGGCGEPWCLLYNK